MQVIPTAEKPPCSMPSPAATKRWATGQALPWRERSAKLKANFAYNSYLLKCEFLTDVSFIESMKEFAAQIGAVGEDSYILEQVLEENGIDLGSITAEDNWSLDDNEKELVKLIAKFPSMIEDSANIKRVHQKNTNLYSHRQQGTA